MTQRERIFARLESQGFITNRDFHEMCLTHIGRNRITDAEAKDYFRLKGLFVFYVGGEDFMEHRWELRRIPQMENATQKEFAI